MTGAQLSDEGGYHRVDIFGDAAPEHASPRSFYVAGHAAQDRRLSGSGLAGQDHQPGERLDGGEEFCADILVHGTRVEGFRVCDVPERPAAAERTIVHHTRRRHDAKLDQTTSE